MTDKIKITGKEKAYENFGVALSKVEVDFGKAKPFSTLKTGSKLSVAYWIRKFKSNVFLDRTIIVNMELNNGFRKMFMVVEKNQGFRYKGGSYVFDNESKYYLVDAKMWCYDFHESFTMPIKRHIPVAEIRKLIENTNITEVENSTNPATLDRFLKAKIAEGIMKGQQLDIVLKQLKLIGIITMVTTVLLTILFVFKTGMLESVKLPFG